jgi:hypothetical protein
LLFNQREVKVGSSEISTLGKWLFRTTDTILVTELNGFVLFIWNAPSRLCLLKEGVFAEASAEAMQSPRESNVSLLFIQASAVNHGPAEQYRSDEQLKVSGLFLMQAQQFVRKMELDKEIRDYKLEQKLNDLRRRPKSAGNVSGPPASLLIK